VAQLAEQLVALAQPGLAPGEEVLGAVRVNYNGTVQPNAATMAGGLGIETGAPDADSIAAFPSAQLMGLVLTGGRILVWSLGFTGKPKSFLGEVPLSAVTEVHAGEISFGPVIRLVMKSGATVDLEIPHKEPGRNDFIDHLRFLVGQGTDSRRRPTTDTPPASAEPAAVEPAAPAPPPPPPPPPPPARGAEGGPSSF
jgi:hypothetical protein